MITNICYSRAEVEVFSVKNVLLCIFHEMSEKATLFFTSLLGFIMLQFP